MFSSTSYINFLKEVDALKIRNFDVLVYKKLEIKEIVHTYCL